MFNRLRVPKASDLVIDVIREEIAEGRLRPGMRLPSERDLSTHLGVSRPVVREALRTLRFVGIIDMKPGATGALILNGNVDILGTSLTMLVDLDHLGNNQIMLVRRALEPLAAEQAAIERQPEHLQEMEEIVDGITSGRYVGTQFSAGNAHFHVTVAAASGNPLLYTIAKSFSRVIYLNLEAHCPPDVAREVACRGLPAIYQAIAEQDPRRARAAMERLLDEASSNMETKLSGMGVVRST